MKRERVRKNWEPLVHEDGLGPGYLTAFHFDAMGDLQETLMPFVTELHTSLGQETKNLKSS